MANLAADIQVGDNVNEVSSYFEIFRRVEFVGKETNSDTAFWKSVAWPLQGLTRCVTLVILFNLRDICWPISFINLGNLAMPVLLLKVSVLPREKEWLLSTIETHFFFKDEVQPVVETKLEY